MDRIEYCEKELKLFDSNNAGAIIQVVCVNGKKMTIDEFKKIKGTELGTNFINKNKRLGTPERS